MRTHDETVKRYLNMLNDLYANLNSLSVTNMAYIKNTYSVSCMTGMMLVKLNIISKEDKVFKYIGSEPSVELVEKVLKAQNRYMAKKRYVK